MAVVLDASLTVAWCFEDETTERTEALLEQVMSEGAVVSAFWSLEVANALRSGFQRDRLDLQRALAFARALDSLPVTADPAASLLSPVEALTLALQYGVTSYDATYIEVAARHGLPLASNDDRIRGAARASGIQVL